MIARCVYNRGQRGFPAKDHGYSQQCHFMHLLNRGTMTLMLFRSGYFVPVCMPISRRLMHTLCKSMQVSSYVRLTLRPYFRDLIHRVVINILKKVRWINVHPLAADSMALKDVMRRKCSVHSLTSVRRHLALILVADSGAENRRCTVSLHRTLRANTFVFQSSCLLRPIARLNVESSRWRAKSK